MKIIRPLEVTEAVLSAVNLNEDDHPQWAGGTAYVRGEYVISTATHSVYRCLVDNTGEDPDLEQVALNDPLIEDPPVLNWLLMGATNIWRLFDSKPSVVCSSPNDLTVTLIPNVVTGGLAVFNVQATSVEVTMTNSGSVVYQRTITMTDESVVFDGWSYCFTEIEPLPEFVLTDLPPYPSAEITVVFRGGGDEVQVGQLIVGPVWSYGYVELGGTGFSGLDFSFVQQDEFGNLTTSRRSATDLHTFDIVLDVSRTLGFRSRMRTLRGGVPAVWVGDDDRNKAATNYGFVRSYKPIYSEGDETLITIEVQGIV